MNVNLHPYTLVAEAMGQVAEWTLISEPKRLRTVQRRRLGEEAEEPAGLRVIHHKIPSVFQLRDNMKLMTCRASHLYVHGRCIGIKLQYILYGMQ